MEWRRGGKIVGLIGRIGFSSLCFIDRLVQEEKRIRFARKGRGIYYLSMGKPTEGRTWGQNCLYSSACCSKHWLWPSLLYQAFGYAPLSLLYQSSQYPLPISPPKLFAMDTHTHTHHPSIISSISS